MVVDTRRLERDFVVDRTLLLLATQQRTVLGASHEVPYSHAEERTYQYLRTELIEH
jgi:hypothetical protein